MSLTAPVIILSAFVGLLVVSQAIILWFIIRMRKKVMTPEELLEEGQRRTNSIVGKAIQQANKILINAELKGIKILSQEKLTGKEIAKRYEEHLLKIENALRKQFDESVSEATGAYSQFITEVEKTMSEKTEENKRIMVDKANAMLTHVQGVLDTFTTDVQAKVKEQVEKELEAARTEIAYYKEQRLAVINERIVDILEQVLRVALEKKLSLADQSDLIYRALDEAKKEHAFTTKRQDKSS